MTPADPREVLSVLRLRLYQAKRMASMLPPEALGVGHKDERTTWSIRDELIDGLQSQIAAVDAAIRGEG